jgi:REG-2-like HAD superfamily hydrolase
MRFRYPIMETYAAAAKWAKLPNPPSVEELKPAFKKAYYKHLTESPCFGHAEGLSSRQWWVRTVKSVLNFCGRDYTDAEFERFFRRVYQHYGSLEGYERLPDAEPFLTWATEEQGLLLGVTTNTPIRTMETVLPMTGHMPFFKFYVCSQDAGCEKPAEGIFQRAYEEAQFWLGPLERDEILHVGDSLEADYCGARAFGFQALHLDRSGNERVTVYQDWLTAPDYPGKSEEDIRENTVKDLSQVRALLMQPPPSPVGGEPQQQQQQRASAAAATASGGGGGGAAAEGYHDSNEVDKTGMEGHVTQVRRRWRGAKGAGRGKRKGRGRAGGVMGGVGRRA